MLICHCCLIKDSQIKESVENGARTIQDIRKACKACLHCMGCTPAILEIIQETLLKLSETEKGDG